MLEKKQKRYRRHKRVRVKIFGTANRPRLCVFRSAKHIYVQLIDDEKGKTLVAASDLEIKRETKSAKQKTLKKKPSLVKTKEGKEEIKTKRTTIAYEVGKLIAEKAHKKQIEKVVFDRGGYQYHGRVKALAEGAREVGLKF